jgi:hypothetical protein
VLGYDIATPILPAIQRKSEHAKFKIMKSMSSGEKLEAKQGAVQSRALTVKFTAH